MEDQFSFLRISDILVAVTGVRDSGQSTFFKSLTAEQHSFHSANRQLIPYPVTLYQGRRVYLLELPGFDGSARHHAETLRQVVRCLNVTYMNGVLLSGIIFFETNELRHLKSEAATVRILQKLCGDIGLRNLVLAKSVSSRTSRIDEAQRRQIWGSLADGLSRALLFNGSKDSALRIVNEVSDLQEKRGPRTLAVQIEMVYGERRLDQTGAGHELREVIAELQAETLEQHEKLGKPHLGSTYTIDHELEEVETSLASLEVSTADLVVLGGDRAANASNESQSDAAERDRNAEYSWPRRLFPTPLEWALEQGGFSDLVNILEQHLTVVATEHWAWLPELFELDFNAHQVAEFLIQRYKEAPWIPFSGWADRKRLPQAHFHVRECVHGNPGIKPAAHDSIDLRDTIASLCGIAGIVPTLDKMITWNGQGTFHRGWVMQYPGLVLCSLGRTVDEEFTMYGVLARIKDALDGFCSAAAELQSHGGCCDRYTYLWTASGDNDAHVATMPFTWSIQLRQRLREINPEQHGFAKSRELSACVAHACMILKNVLPEVEASAHTPAPAYVPVLQLHYCALAVQFLCLSLASYCQAHVGGLQFFFLERKIYSAILHGIVRRPKTGHDFQSTTICMGIRRLTCLDGMLKRPIIVFSSGMDDLNMESEESQHRYDLVATPEDIVDTWGPASLITPHKPKSPWNEDPVMICGILIRGGIIQNVDNRSWHWSVNAGPQQLGGSGARLTQLIRIGALVTKNLCCNLDEAGCLSISDGFRDTLGTYSPFWQEKQRQVGFSGGQYVNLQYIHVMEKDPGRTLKMQKVENLHRLLNTASSDTLLPFLEGPWGLQVSFCSGLARRVEMRELFADVLPIWIQRKVPSPGKWTILRDTYHVLDVLRRGDLNSWIQKLFDEDYDCYTLFCESIVEITNQLAHTGVDKSSDYFVIAWIPSQRDIDSQCIKVAIANNNFWTSVLQDSQDCATFAYLTLECLQAQGRGCQNPNGSLPNQLCFVETEVYRHFNGPVNKNNTNPQSRWVLQHDHVYAIGRAETVGLMQLQAHVNLATGTGIPRLVVKPRNIPYGIWMRFMRTRMQTGRLRERNTPFETAHRVTIASSEE